MTTVMRRLEELMTERTATGEGALVAALGRLARLPGVTGYRPADAWGALRRHRQRLNAWLIELSSLGEEGHCDLLVAELAACDLALTGEPPLPLTFDQLIAEAVSRGGSPEELAGELLRGCPSRDRRHWDHLLARVEAALARTR